MTQPSLKWRDRASMTEAMLPDDIVTAFKSGFRGNLIGPADAEYDAARRLWNAGIDRYPGLIARCADTQDVAAAVRLARRHRIPLAIKGGGHGVTGWALCDGGLVIDMSAMNRVVMHPETGMVVAGAGARVGDLSTVTSAFGRAVPMGAHSRVGIAGLTSGGGIGWLSRRYGLACDNLMSCEIVTADGASIVADAQANPDLFWGVRGGAGNFGVMTTLVFQSHPVDRVLGGIVLFPRSEATNVLRQYRAFMQTAPDTLTAYAALMSTPDGVPAVAVMVCHCGSPEDAMRDVAPIRAFATPLVDMIAPMPFDVMQRIADAGSPDGFRNRIQSALMPELTDGAIAQLVGHAERAPSPFCMTLVQCLGGAIARTPLDATAFPHRHAAYNIGIEARWTDAEDDATYAAWTAAFADALRPYSAATQLVNFLGDDSADAICNAFGPHYGRLQQLKRQYDPTNLFLRCANIRPG